MKEEENTSSFFIYNNKFTRAKCSTAQMRTGKHFTAHRFMVTEHRYGWLVRQGYFGYSRQ
jgi:hypothetical protein